MPKFQIDLDDATYEALGTLATEELRDLPRQAAWLLMQAMRERSEKRAWQGPVTLSSGTLDAGASYGP